MANNYFSADRGLRVRLHRLAYLLATSFVGEYNGGNQICVWELWQLHDYLQYKMQNDERLMHDHAELGGLLSQLIATLDSNDVARIYATLDLFWARLAMHIRAEHLHLFEAILQAVNRKTGAPDSDTPSSAEAAKTIEELREDHNFFMRELSQAVATMRGLTANPQANIAEELQDVRKRIDAVQKRLVRHNEIEEKGIYLWTKTVLTQAEQAELAALVDKELKNTPPRFQ